MIFDASLVLSGGVNAAGALIGQAANGAGNVLSTNTVDLGGLPLNQIVDVGAGEALEVSFTVLTAPTVGTSVQFQLIQADDAALSSNVQVIDQTDAYPIASLPAGTQVPLHYDRAAPYLPKRYVGVRYINVGAIATFSVFAGIVKNLQDTKNLYGKNGFGIT